ncbi:GntP family permease [Arundinibacter roseus]|uniref:GntP family permease n=1 Tax=Arundinibacter roseus TaxID=2070510 RepID=A0A4R4KM55_9BACT|nr:GntP family permease [Arundinibacter roseus]TDB68096.1 GntP family permease [Arundinibacter roseus]
MFTLLVILISLALIILAIIKFDIHPFLALFVGAIIYGLLAGMPGDLILKSITEGFGGVLGSIGLLILLGVMIGTFLEKTGGAFVIAQRILAAIGEKSVMLAMMITGYILSIPVFGDSAFIMMNPINKSLSFKGKLPYATTTVALTLGISASHSLVPPTPGPIAATGILEADLGMVILWGIIVSALALVPCYFFIQRFTRHIHLVPQFAEVKSEAIIGKKPGLGKSFMPIIIPLLLIVLASIAKYPTQPFGDNSFTTTLLFVGSPVIALLIGAFLSFMLPEKFDAKLLSSSGWIGESLLIAAPVILITGAGGVFGKMLQNSGIADLVSSNLSAASWGIFLPFLMALALKTAQGSSTVALITTASIVAPLLATLGLDSEMMRVFTVLSIGAGAIAISHANDSFFWAMTQLSGMNIKQGNQTHSLGTLVLATSAIMIIYVLTQLI